MKLSVALADVFRKRQHLFRVVRSKGFYRRLVVVMQFDGKV